MEFSLFLFAHDASSARPPRYRLLLEAARFADRHDFCAVWVPERHFQEFGGLYPNPSVLVAALAVATERIQLRAGSLVLPLHHPLRVAEDWAVSDNLSGGRVGVSFASGWHPADFLLAPERFDHRKEVMFEGIDLVRRLWRGDAVRLPGVGGKEQEVRLLPRPVQPGLPVWVTCAGHPETWERAGAIGANVLTAYVSQSPEDLARRIWRYRASRAGHGHDPHAGRVTVMLHAFLGDEDAQVKEQVRGPMMAYLRGYLRQGKGMASAEQGTGGGSGGGLPAGDAEAIARSAFERYYRSASLLGTEDKAARLVETLAGMGVDEVACLVDFGLPPGQVLDALPRLDRLRARCATRVEPLPPSLRRGGP